jgi:hypothetical protein
MNQRNSITKLAPSVVRVFVPFIVSGDGESFGPNVTVEVDASEAERLVSLGAKVVE